MLRKVPRLLTHRANRTHDFFSDAALEKIRVPVAPILKESELSDTWSERVTLERVPRPSWEGVHDNTTANSQPRWRRSQRDLQAAVKKKHRAKIPVESPDFHPCTLQLADGCPDGASCPFIHAPARECLSLLRKGFCKDHQRGTCPWSHAGTTPPTLHAALPLADVVSSWCTLKDRRPSEDVTLSHIAAMFPSATESFVRQTLCNAPDFLHVELSGDAVTIDSRIAQLINAGATAAEAALVQHSRAALYDEKSLVYALQALAMAMDEDEEFLRKDLSAVWSCLLGGSCRKMTNETFSKSSGDDLRRLLAAATLNLKHLGLSTAELARFREQWIEAGLFALCLGDAPTFSIVCGDWRCTMGFHGTARRCRNSWLDAEVWDSPAKNAAEGARMFLRLIAADVDTMSGTQTLRLSAVATTSLVLLLRGFAKAPWPADLLRKGEEIDGNVLVDRSAAAIAAVACRVASNVHVPCAIRHKALSIMVAKRGRDPHSPLCIERGDDAPFVIEPSDAPLLPPTVRALIGTAPNWAAVTEAVQLLLRVFGAKSPVPGGWLEDFGSRTVLCVATGEALLRHFALDPELTRQTLLRFFCGERTDTVLDYYLGPTLKKTVSSLIGAFTVEIVLQRYALGDAPELSASELVLVAKAAEHAGAANTPQLRQHVLNCIKEAAEERPGRETSAALARMQPSQ